jgi:hypothetical protein
LRILREAGFVRVRQEAQRHWYELRPEPLKEIDAWLASYRHLWEARLDRLDSRSTRRAQGIIQAGQGKGEFVEFRDSKADYSVCDGSCKSFF